MNNCSRYFSVTLAHVVFALFVTLNSHIASAQWVRKDTGITGTVQTMAASGGNLFAGSSSGGFFVSTNGAASWVASNSGLSTLDVRSIAVSGSTLYAATSVGVFLSTDNGANWTVRNTGLGNLNVIALYANGSTVLAGTGSGLYRSIDNGANWTVATGATTGAYTSFLASGTAIFTGKAGQGVYKSTDSGASWVAVINGLFHFDITCFAGIGSLIMAGSNGGIYTTSDGGANWTRLTDQGAPLGNITSLAVRASTVFAGIQSTGLLISPNGGTSWFSADFPFSIASVFDAGAPDVFASAGPSGLWARPYSEFVIIDSFTPSSGTTGSTVIINGSGFSSTPANNIVRFNGSLAATVTSAVPTTLTVNVPVSASTGPIDVTVGTLTGRSSSNFTVPIPPTITSFSPTSGPVGTTVIITGTGFSTVPANNTVIFSGTPAIVTASTSTTITTSVPVGATSGVIQINVNSLSAFISSFTVIPPPTITSFTPVSGPVGTSVTITGTNFSATPANNTVSFNGTAATVTASTATSITTTVPAGATTGTISVLVNSLTATSALNFTVTIPPTITSFTPASGPVGSTVTITGTNFSATPANNTVRFNGTLATVSASTATGITTTVPAGATTGTISVMVNSSTAMSASNFTVIPPPIITSFAPASGPVGTTVTITGTNFSATPANNTVSFNGTAATVTASTATSITTTVPAGATTGTISVLVNSLTATSASNFTVTIPPTITSFTPASGLIGATVTITGTNFSATPANNTVRFNGILATVSASTTTSITTTVPAGATTGTLSVMVTSLTATSASNFTVTIPPTITSFTPTSGPAGTSVTISGTNFSATPANNTVRFNGTAATVTASTSTTITTTVPAGATTGTISVTVTSLTATSATNFTVPDATKPVVTNATAASVAQGNPVTIAVALTDAESGITSANLLYRSITAGGTFTTVALTFGTGNNYSQTIPAASVGELGIEYQFDVTNGVGLKNDVVTYTAKVSILGNGVVIPYSSPGVEVSNYRLVSVPLDLTAKTVGDVFNELGPLDNTKWRISRYQGTANQEMNLSSPIEPGNGYWLIAKTDPGIINSGAGVSVGATSATPFTINLAAGWNQIGNPYNFNLSWADVQAANAGLPGLRKFDGTFIDATVLNKMEGGFVNVTAARTLVVPVVKNVAANSGRVALNRHPFENSLTEKNWQVYLELNHGNLKNKIAGFGMHEKASGTMDVFDGLTMPRFFGSWLEVNHTKTNTNNLLSKDIVPTAENHVWEFNVEASGEAEVMTFTWDNSYFGSGSTLYLWDVAQQRGVDMRTENNYSFSKNQSKIFRVAFGSEDFVKKETEVTKAILYGAYPNPASTQEDVTISFSVPESATGELVSIGVFDMLGRSVLNSEVSYQGGYHEVKWRRTEKETGGLYVITLRAGNELKQVRVVLR